MDPSNPEFGRE
ncbi:hypothetical protein A2U01_0068182, partial [Trifolium medium]|nr:hypothetical protein [Trifolium medium]